MSVRYMVIFLLLSLFLAYLWSCSTPTPYFYFADDIAEQQPVSTPLRPAAHQPVRASNNGRHDYKVRVITEQELLRLHDRDKDLTLSRCWEILARLNSRAGYYISHDIENGRPLKVPKDFSAFKDWTPLPGYVPDVAGVPKMILITKDIPFLGWYEHGKLVGDSLVCIGKTDELTEAGLYRVRSKDQDHISRSYNNAFGAPSPMPYGLRIYGNVWIHGGDIASGYCSHGCINLPLHTAEHLFQWSTQGTAVVVVNSLGELPRVLAENRTNCNLYASQCNPQKIRIN